MPTSPSYGCVPVSQGIELCYPSMRPVPAEPVSPFYVAIDPKQCNAESDGELLHRHFGKLMERPNPVLQTPEALLSKHGWRIYDVTGGLHKKIVEKVWRRDYYQGPNCYQSALCISGFEDMCGRYVDKLEAEFVLSLFFRPTKKSDCVDQYGKMAVFNEAYSGFTFQHSKTPAELVERMRSLALEKEKRRYHLRLPLRSFYEMAGPMSSGRPPYYEGGAHMATSLGGAIFHKLSYDYRDGYYIDTIDAAMKRVEDAAIDRLPPFERIHGKRWETKYDFTCYEEGGYFKIPRNSKDMEDLPKIDWPVEDRRKFMILFLYYSRRIEDIERAIEDVKTESPFVVFDRMRPSLLTMENYWRVLRDFNDKIGYDLRGSLVKDLELAFVYLKAHSLSWQHQSMSDIYYEMKPGYPRDYYDKKLRELYERHYFKADRYFVQEILVHLEARNIPREARPKIVKKVMEELTREENGKRVYDPADYALSNGSKGAPFFDILENAIKSFIEPR